MELSKREEAVIKAMRMGAKVSVNFHRVKDLETAEDYIKLFDEFPHKEYGLFGFYKSSDHVYFSKEMESLDISCFLDLENNLAKENSNVAASRGTN